jgi:hypothetical protein
VGAAAVAQRCQAGEHRRAAQGLQWQALLPRAAHAAQALAFAALPACQPARPATAPGAPFNSPSPQPPSLLPPFTPSLQHRPLEIFFPFDPYLLRRSADHLALGSTYVRWRRGHPAGAVRADLEDASDSDTDSEDEGSEMSEGAEEEDVGPAAEVRWVCDRVGVRAWVWLWV